MSSLPETIVKWFFYLGAPFFGNPVKPLLNSAFGTSYDLAYLHFRRDHNKDFNLALHLICFIFQLTYNFGLLAELDRSIKGSGSGPALGFALLTFVGWVVTLALTPAPFGVTAISALCLALAYTFRNVIVKRWWNIMAVQAVIEAFAVEVFLINKIKPTEIAKTAPLPVDLTHIVVYLAIRWLLQRLLQQYQGALSSGSKIVSAIVLLYVGVTSLDPFGRINPFLLGLPGWLLALLTGQPWLFFYAGGFLASTAQGVSHYYSHELATLPTLRDVNLGAAELSHATFFPNLLLNSVYETLTGSPGFAVNVSH